MCRLLDVTGQRYNAHANRSPSPRVCVCRNGRSGRLMLERGLTEIELRVTLEHARSVGPSHVEGRFVVETQHQGSEWAIVLEPDFELECVAVVTVYNREETVKA